MGYGRGHSRNPSIKTVELGSSPASMCHRHSSNSWAVLARSCFRQDPDVAAHHDPKPCFGSNISIISNRRDCTPLSAAITRPPIRNLVDPMTEGTSRHLEMPRVPSNGHDSHNVLRFFLKPSDSVSRLERDRASRRLPLVPIPNQALGNLAGLGGARTRPPRQHWLAANYFPIHLTI